MKVPLPTVCASGFIQTNAATHLYSAARRAEEIVRTTEEDAGGVLGPTWSIIFEQSLALAILAGASLEAFANEILSPGTSATALDNSMQRAIRRKWTEIERMKPLNKLDHAFRLVDKKLDKGRGVGQRAAMVIVLRDWAVHFQPRRDDLSQRHKETSRRLKNFASHSPLVSPGDPLFPLAWASAATCRTILDAVSELGSFVARQLHAQSPYSNQKSL